MPVSDSGDLRRRVIIACFTKEGSQRQLAERFKQGQMLTGFVYKT